MMHAGLPVTKGIKWMASRWIRGEDYLKAKFEAALDKADLGTEARQVVERAYQSVRSGHDQISQLKHGMETNS